MIIYYHMTQMKRCKIYSALMSVCILLTSCSSGGGSSYETKSEASSNAAVTSVSSVTVTTAPVTTVPVTTAQVTTAPETTKSITTVKPETAAPSASATATAATEKPKWIENKADETLYVTVDCYERTGAYIGAPAGSILKRGSKIAVTATTDTDYYKLKNGRYIHKDYTSRTKPSETAQPASNVPAAGSFEEEVNKVTLKPVRTNTKKLDDLVDRILAKIITKGMTNSQKLKAIYDYIIANSSYEMRIIDYDEMMTFGDNAYLSDEDAITAYYAYLILSDGYGVCDNYSSAFTVLARAVGFDCYSIGGNVAYSGGGYTGHKWNNIKVGNTWYEFDTQIEDKYNELNGYTSYFYYGKVRNSNPTLYIYPENLDEVIGWYKGFRFADPMKCVADITVGDKNLKLRYEQKKSNLEIWGNADYTDDYIKYENKKLPQLNVKLSISEGTAPFDYEVIVSHEKDGTQTYLMDETKFSVKDKSATFSLKLPEYGEYTVEYRMRDSSSREIFKMASVSAYDNSALKGELTVKKETRKDRLDCGNTYVKLNYTGGGKTNCFDCIAYGDEETAYGVFGNDECWFNLTKGKKYLIVASITDSKGKVHDFSKEFTYK